jgi:hypothetical protein
MRAEGFAERDVARTGVFELVDVPGKGRGLTATRALRCNELVLHEECAFLRMAKRQCVKCGNAAHDLSSCESEAAALAKTFGADSVGLLGQFFVDKTVLPLLFRLHMHEGAKEDEANVRRFYDGCSKRLRDRLEWEDFVKLYRVCETNAHTASAVEGMGVFPLVAMLNHACDPNCTYVATEGVRMVVKTTRSVVQGEELTVGYTTAFLPVTIRQRVLKARYGFTCTCSRCAPTAVDLSRAFVCGCSAEGVLCPIGRGDKNSDWKCLACKREPSGAEIGKFIAAEVYPNLVNSLVRNAKEPSSFLSWEKLRARTNVLSFRHWLVYFGQMELIAKEPEAVLCRLIVAMFKFQNRACVFSDDFTTLVQLLSKCASDALVRQDAEKLAALEECVVKSVDTRDGVEREFEKLFSARLWPYVQERAKAVVNKSTY